MIPASIFFHMMTSISDLVTQSLKLNFLCLISLCGAVVLQYSEFILIPNGGYESKSKECFHFDIFSELMSQVVLWKGCSLHKQHCSPTWLGLLLVSDLLSVQRLSGQVLSEKCIEKGLFVGPRVLENPPPSAAVSAGRYRSTRDRNVFNFGLLFTEAIDSSPDSFSSSEPLEQN